MNNKQKSGQLKVLKLAETDRFFAASGVHLPPHDRGQFHYRHAAFSSHLKPKIGNILTKV
jgi:hypothetical protein